MNIQQIIDQDPRAKEIRQKYQELLQKKNQCIMDISYIEGDIIKLMGRYEEVSKEVVAKIQGVIEAHGGKDALPVEVAPVEPEPTDPGDAPEVAEENQDDGFADAKVEDKAPVIIPPTAENTNPTGSQE